MTLDYGVFRVIKRGVGHGVILNNPVLPIQCLKQSRDLKFTLLYFVHDLYFPLSSSLSSSDDSETNPNSSEMKEAFVHGVSDADLFELFESWCEKYGKQYSSEEEKRYKFKVFKDNYPVKAHGKNYLCLAFLNEYAAIDLPNGSSHPLDFEDAIWEYGFHGACYNCEPPEPQIPPRHHVSV